MNILHVDLGVADWEDPDQLLEAFPSLTGWCESLVEAGADRVDVVQRFPSTAVIERNGVTYRFCADHRSPLYPATSVMTFRQALESAHADVVHVNGLGFPLGTRLLRSLLPRRTPILVQDHANGPPSNVFSRSLARGAFRQVDGYLFTAARQAEPWRAAGVIGHEQRIYEVLEASTKLRPMARAAARDASGVDGSPALLWVGRLNANKDPLTVLAGFERIVVPCPAASLTMVFGSDELLPELRSRLSASPALGRRVRLVGYVPQEELPAYYSAADIFVLGSHHEGSGYALIEACACGAVPVVTGIPAFRAITGDGARGALWPPGDAIGLAHALLEMAKRDLAGLRAALAVHFANELSWTAVGRRAVDIYAEVRARRRSSR